MFFGLKNKLFLPQRFCNKFWQKQILFIIYKLQRKIPMKEEALKFIKEHTKYRYVKTIGLDGCYSRCPDPDKEYYVEPWVAREAVEIAIKGMRKK